jgi:hypothetical protein
MFGFGLFVWRKESQPVNAGMAAFFGQKLPSTFLAKVIRYWLRDWLIADLYLGLARHTRPARPPGGMEWFKSRSGPSRVTGMVKKGWRSGNPDDGDR